MKTYITTSTTSTTGYEIVTKDEDNAIVEVKHIESIVDDGKTLKLPENPSNRKYFSIEKVKANNDTIELTYKESVKLGERTSSKKLEDYLTDEEKKIIEDIMNKARERKEADKKKPATKEDKIRAQIEKYQKMLEKLEAEG